MQWFSINSSRTELMPKDKIFVCKDTTCKDTMCKDTVSVDTMYTL